MLSNVSVRKSEKNGKITWRLLGPGGLPLKPFEIFADALVDEKLPLNTREAYCYNLAGFIDYVYEAVFALTAEQPELQVTSDLIDDVLKAYDEYLVLGSDSANKIAKLVDKTRPSPRNTAGTSATKHAPIRKFLQLSELARRQTLELIQAGLKLGDFYLTDGKPLTSGIGTRTPVSEMQRRAMTATSMLTGVIAGGATFLKAPALQNTFPQITYDSSRAFPYDRIAEFIRALPTYRDKSFYSLLAASGCRGHEGIQLLFDDIDVIGGTVKLVDPRSRPNHKSYLYLSFKEREQLAWKGRTTNITMLIEPFASMFFENLAEYMRNEYIPHGHHRFVFQYLTPQFLGKPYFLSLADSRLDAFKKAISQVGITNAIHGPHSLRHAYGVYLLNYFPRINGDYGLPLSFVQQIMGHASIKSTMKYAIYDEELLRNELRYANAMVFNGVTPKSIAQFRLEALNAQVIKIQEELDNDFARRVIA